MSSKLRFFDCSSLKQAYRSYWIEGRYHCLGRPPAWRYWQRGRPVESAGRPTGRCPWPQLRKLDGTIRALTDLSILKNLQLQLPVTSFVLQYTYFFSRGFPCFLQQVGNCFRNVNIPISKIKGSDMVVFVAVGMDEGRLHQTLVCR